MKNTKARRIDNGPLAVEARVVDITFIPVSKATAISDI